MPTALLFFLILICLLGLYGWFVEPRWMVRPVNKITVAGGRLPRAVRFLFLSDIHIGKHSAKMRIRERIESLRREHEARPFSAILVSGDWLDLEAEYIPGVLETARQLAAFGIPVYAIIGNHDHQEWEGEKEVVCQAIREAGVILLENNWVGHTDRLTGIEFQIIGSLELQLDPSYMNPPVKELSDYVTRVRRMHHIAALTGLDPKKPTMLLTHNPDGVYLPLPVEPDLVLAGHTHGGQFIFFEWMMDRLGLWRHMRDSLPPGSFLSWAGSGRFNNRNLLVSRGFGSAHWPLRILRRPEAHTVVLAPEPKAADNLVIGISGKARSGKDTLANLLLSSLPSLRRTAFAIEVKKEYDRRNGTNTLGNESDKIKHRNGLNELGLELARNDPNHLIDRALNQPRPLLVTDVRLTREADAVQAAGGVLIRVEALPDTLLKRAGASYEANRHTRNETQLDDYRGWDYVLNNDGTLPEFVARASAVIASIVEEYQFSPDNPPASEVQ